MKTSRSRQRPLCRVAFVLYFICAQRMPAVDSAAFAAVEDKVTSPSRNDATNPLKEPTPSTLQGAFLGGNLTDDANNGSTSTPSAEASTAAAARETVWNVRTAAAATPAAHRRDGSATAARPEPATTTGRPLVPRRNAVHASAERQPSPQFGTGANGDNLMANMLKDWFADKGDSAAADKGYYKLATEYLQDNGVGPANGNGNGGGGPSEASSNSATAAAASGGNRGLFERWDEASEEQERVLEDAMRSERTVGDSPSSVLAADHQNTPSRWFVLLLSGNSTVAQMRRTDFAKYLKLNLAARLSLEYDELRINRVLVVPPRLMVNVSVVPVTERASAAAAAQHVPATEAAAATAVAASAVTAVSSSSSSWPVSVSDAAASDRAMVVNDDPLHNLVETNATLMELSGEEYRVERFMSLKSQKPQSTDEATATVSDRHADIDFFIYATVGPLCFVAVLGFASFALYKCARKHPVRWPWKRKFRHPSFWPGGDHHHQHRRMTDGRDGGASADDTDDGGGSVNVIYSGEFEQSQQQQLSGSWLDDASFVPDDSLDRIRTPTLLRTPAAKCKTFTDMVHGQCGDGGIDDMRRRRGQCAAAAAPQAAVHAHSPRLGRDNKLRILGCKQSCLLLPAVQPAADRETTTARENDRP